MKLYLTRHGETDWNLASRIQGKTDIPLNERGRQQARELAEMLKERRLSLDRIYTSKLSRARETAEIVGKELRLPVTILEGIEEMDLGKWEGYTWKQVRESFSGEYSLWHENRRYQKTPDGESYEELLQRILPGLCGILGDDPCRDKKGQGSVLVVTHSAVIMTLLSYFHDTPFQDMAKNFKTKNAELVELTTEQMKLLQQIKQEKSV